jgi:integrase
VSAVEAAKAYRLLKAVFNTAVDVGLIRRNPALRAAGLPPVHFHDLRNSGNQLAADEGASLRELMEHMGHDSARAALIYLHTSAERQRAIADRVGKNAKAALGKHKRSGTRMARKAKRTS